MDVWDWIFYVGYPTVGVLWVLVVGHLAWPSKRSGMRLKGDKVSAILIATLFGLLWPVTMPLLIIVGILVVTIDAIKGKS